MERSILIGTGDSIQAEGCFSPRDGEHSSIKWNEQYSLRRIKTDSSQYTRFVRHSSHCP